MTTTVKRVDVGSASVFYREAGEQHARSILLLHGFPTSSFQYRNLIPKLATTHHVIAPDIPGFGFTDVSDANYDYTFEHLAQTIIAFTRILNLNKFAIYIFDYGAPVGLRLAIARPEAITAIISQNGNAFEAGLSSFWDGIREYWKNPSAETLAPVEALTKIAATKFQYTHGEAHPEKIPPETYHLDQALLDRPGNAEIQHKLFFDYQTNVALYPTFHEYFRAHTPPVLAVWGKNDPIFAATGAEAYKSVLPDAEVHFVDGGHFALENHLEEIYDRIANFLAKHKA